MEEECRRLRSKLFVEKDNSAVMKDLLLCLHEERSMLLYDNKVWHDLQDKSFDGLQEIANQKAALQVQLVEALVSNADLLKENQELAIKLAETQQEAIDRMKQINEKMVSLNSTASSRRSRLFHRQ